MGLRLQNLRKLKWRQGGLIVSALDYRLSSWDQTLAGDIVLCSSVRHFTLTVPLYPGVQLGTGEFNTGGNLVIDYCVTSRGENKNP